MPIDPKTFRHESRILAPVLMGLVPLRRLKRLATTCLRHRPDSRTALASALSLHRFRTRRLRHGITPGRLFRTAVRAVVFFHIWYLSVICLLCGLYTFMNPSITGYMVYRVVDSGHKILPQRYIPMDQIPRSLQRAFLRLEDHGFYEHHGISLGAIREAMERNSRLDRMVFGGSTISQQLARNLFLNPDRNIVRKYLEMLAVFPMELILGKRRILDLYMNNIEFGKGAFGLGRGAIVQYGKSFYKLSADERLRLAVIITSPIRYNVNTFWKQPGMAARYRALTQ